MSYFLKCKFFKDVFYRKNSLKQKCLKVPVFSRLFGGGIKKLLRTASVTSSNVSHPHLQHQQSVQTPPSEEAGNTAANWLSKQRVKLNTKLLGHQPTLMKEDKATYREQFVPPEMSVLAFLLQKVSTFECVKFEWIRIRLLF